MRSFEEIKEKYIQDQQNTGITSPGILGAAINVLEKACGGKENRYLFMKMLTGKIHSTELSFEECWALVSFVQPMKDPLTGKWGSVRAADFEQEVRLVLAKSADQPGQEKLL